MMSSTNSGYYSGYPYYRQMYPYQMPNYQQFNQPAQQQQSTVPTTPQMPSGSTIQTPGTPPAGVQVPGILPIEQSYIENILRLNKGKHVTVYMTFDASKEWNSKIFRGVIEAAGRDHLVLSDPETGYRYLLPMVYFNYAVFEEEIEYSYPFSGLQQQPVTYQPR